MDDLKRPLRLAVTLAVLVLALAPVAAQTKPARAVIRGQAYAGSLPVSLRDGQFWGPLAPLARLFGAQVQEQAGGRRLEIVTPTGLQVALAAGDPGQRLAFTGQTLFGPLAGFFEALGARLQQDRGEGVFIANAALRGIQYVGNEQALGVVLNTSAPVTGKVTYLTEPDRVCLDVPGLQLDHDGAQYLGVAGVWRLRWSQYQSRPAIARFVLDLREPREVRWEPTAQGGRLVVGELPADAPPFVPQPPRLEKLDLRTEPGQSGTLKLQFSGPVEYTWQMARTPYRLVLSFPEAVGAAETRGAEPDGPLQSATVVATPGKPGLTISLPLNWLLRSQLAADASGREVTLTLRRESLAGKRIVIDPGHGGKDPGAQARGLNEKDINLEVAVDLAARLQQAGALVTLTRDRDVFVPLTDRPALATGLHADAFVAVHCNAMGHPNSNYGTESYYYTEQSQVLALLLQRALVQGLGRRDNWVRQHRYAVLWRSPAPCALVELMYLDWDAEGDLLRTPATRQLAADSLAAGLRGYFEGVPVTPPTVAPALAAATPTTAVSERK
ncbi:MAG TPA: N-acetylmuramoyl-L-alanine amidase [Armatimonadota bacterium]